MRSPEHPIIPEQERPPKGVAFVFSCGVNSYNPDELDTPSKERLDTAWGLYKQGKIDAFLLTGGEFIEGLEKPVSSLMKEYLVAKLKICWRWILHKREKIDCRVFKKCCKKFGYIKKVNSLTSM